MPVLLFYELDYGLINAVRVLVLCYEGIAQIEQALDYNVALDVGKVGAELTAGLQVGIEDWAMFPGIAQSAPTPYANGTA